jgi:hypothetical protein
VILFVAATAVLEPQVVVGVGAASRALAQRLLRSSDAELRGLRGVVGPELIAAIGGGEQLPWVDGAQYLGCHPNAPRLYLPTALQPDVPCELLELALLAAAGELAPPLAVLAEPARVFSLADALPIARVALQAWLERAR